MKKILALVLVICVSLCFFAACANVNENSTDSNQEKPATAKKIGVILVGDESEGYSLAHINGIKAAQAALGLKDDQILYKKKIGENSGCKDAAIELIGEGCSLIISNSYGHQDFIYEAASQYPDVKFVAATGDYAAISNLNNFYNCFTDVYESRFVSGVVAGLKLKEMIENTANAEYSGTDKLNTDNYDANGNIKIGYVGAYPYAEVVSGYTAFYLGIKSIVPNVVMEVEFTESWFSIEKEAASAKSLMSKKCVIIGQHADSTGAPAAVEAAHKDGTYTNVYSVGYNVSMLEAAPTVALTSATNGWNVYYTTLFKAFVEGNAIPQDWAEGYSQNAVGITDLGTACAAGTAEKVAEVVDAIKAGTTKVFDVSTFTVGGKTITEEDAKVDLSYFDFSGPAPVEVFHGETKNPLKTENGVTYFDESALRAAPYFSLLIDGITQAQ